MTYEAEAGGVSRIFLNFVPERIEGEGLKAEISTLSDGRSLAYVRAEENGVKTIRFSRKQ